ncbi:SH3 domain-containing protein [Candidatus Peregrinibacteria bacterium]|nr:SH3 domain-containing protein [Candidatus Peregrinibacteria bacterium]
MKNKNPWKFLRCIGIAPWHIPLGEQRFAFFDPPGGADIPDGGVPAAEEGADESVDTDSADTDDETPADADVATHTVAQRYVETGQESLIRNAALTHDSAKQYLRGMFESLPPALKTDDEAQKAYLDADKDLNLARTVEERMAIIEDLQTHIDRYDLSYYTQTAVNTADESPLPAADGEEGEGEAEGEILPPTTPTGGESRPASPEIRRLTDTERIARTLKINVVNKDKIAKALDVPEADKSNDAKLVTAVRKFQQELWEAATPADKKKFEARYRNAKRFGDGIWGQDTQALFEAVAKYTDGKDRGFAAKLAKLNPPAAQAAAVAEGAPAAPPTAPAGPEIAAALLPDLPVASRPTFNAGPLAPSSYPKIDYDEYSAKKGAILVLYKDKKDGSGNTEYEAGTPVIVSAEPRKEDNENISMRVATVDGKDLGELSAEDDLEKPNEAQIRAFVDRKFAREKAAWDKQRLEDTDHLYDRDVVFANDATDVNGVAVKAGARGKSTWNLKDGYIVTISGTAHQFNVAPGQLPVKDVKFDEAATGQQYAKVNGSVYVFQRGEKTGVSVPVKVGENEVVMILGKTDDGGYMIRTKDGVEGYISRGGIREETRVARAANQDMAAVLAAVEAKANPPAAVATTPPAQPAVPAIAPPPSAS